VRVGSPTDYEGEIKNQGALPRARGFTDASRQGQCASSSGKSRRWRLSHVPRGFTPARSVHRDAEAASPTRAWVYPRSTCTVASGSPTCAWIVSAGSQCTLPIEGGDASVGQPDAGAPHLLRRWGHTAPRSLRLPSNCVDVTNEKIGTVIEIVGATAAKGTIS
jgi:hypothetical protein